jgi:hypothetical protein
MPAPMTLLVTRCFSLLTPKDWSGIRAGWAKLGEWTDEAAESEQIEQRNKPQGPKAVYAKGSVEWQQQQERETFARIAAAEEKERRRLARVAAVLGNKS